MAVDTMAKRMSAVGARRLPWMRRFTPVADGTIGQADRQSVGFVYGGIAAGAPVAVPDPVAIEFSMTITRTCDRILKV